MANTALGVSLTIITPFGVLFIAEIARKLGVSAEGSRKLVHILLSNWILLALMVYRSAWAACLLPACFIPLNYISYRKGIFSAIERDEENTLGTVWYAVSLFLLCLTGYAIDMPWLAACGMLAMGYGDGLGALVGKRWGKSRFPGVHSQKSLEGMLTVMLFSGLAVGVVCAIYAPDIAPDITRGITPGITPGISPGITPGISPAISPSASSGLSSVISSALSPTHDLPFNFALQAALACAVPAGVIELFTPLGLDNLTLPLGVSLIVYLLARFPTLLQVFACLGIALIILIAAYYLRAITYWATLAAALLGVSLFVFGGWQSFAALVVFFLLGSAVSHIGKNKKSAALALHERRGARSAVQVTANGLPSLIFAILYRFTGAESCLLAVIACFAAAAADTFSSEIGMLSNKTPISILTHKPIQRGLSGGITFLGLCGGGIGAIMLSILAIPRFGLQGMLMGAITGLVSSALDSLLGAAYQAKYRIKASCGDGSSGDCDSNSNGDCDSNGDSNGNGDCDSNGDSNSGVNGDGSSSNGDGDGSSSNSDVNGSSSNGGCDSDDNMGNGIREDNINDDTGNGIREDNIDDDMGNGVYEADSDDACIVDGGDYRKCASWRLTERESVNGSPLQLAEGIKWVNNDVVNFVSTFICGAILAFIWNAFL